MLYVGELELAIISVKGLIIDPDVQGLLFGPSDILHLSNNYGKVVHTDVITRDVAMVIDGGRGHEVFLQPFPKSLCRFPYVLIITIQLVTVLPVDYPTFLCDVVPILGCHQEVPNSVASFEMDLGPHLTTFLKLSHNPLVYGTTMWMLLLLLLLLFVLL